MLMKALWDGRCRPLRNARRQEENPLFSFGLKLVFLEQTEDQPLRVSIWHESTEVAQGLTVGDVVQHELGIEVPNGAFIVPLSPIEARLGVSGRTMPLVAEVLYAALSSSDIDLPLSLYVWAYLSLTAAFLAEDPGLVLSRDAALEVILDYPTDRAEISLESYLELVEPGFMMPIPDMDLLSKLRGCKDISDWLGRVEDSFNCARQMHLAQF